MNSESPEKTNNLLLQVTDNDYIKYNSASAGIERTTTVIGNYCIDRCIPHYHNDNAYPFKARLGINRVEYYAHLLDIKCSDVSESSQYC